MDDTTRIGFVLAGVLFALTGLFLFFLYASNRGSCAFFHKQSESKVVKTLIFIVEDVLIEVMGIVFVVFAMINVENFPSMCSCLKPLRIAFYVFSSLKFAVLILGKVIHYKMPKLPYRVSLYFRGYLRYDWPDLLESYVLMGTIMVDGMLLNVEFYFQDRGDMFEGDGIVLVALDVILLLKLFVRITLRVHSTREGLGVQYNILGIAWAFCSVYYSLMMSILFVMCHLLALIKPPTPNNPPTVMVEMPVTFSMKLVLSVFILHPLVSGYTSLMRQQIIATSSSLKTAPQLMKQSYMMYTKWLQIWPCNVWTILNAFAYVVTGYCYLTLITITLEVKDAALNGNTANPTALDLYVSVKFGIIMVLVVSHVLNAWLMINLVYGALKRIGPKLRMHAPFNDATYKQALARMA